MEIKKRIAHRPNTLSLWQWGAVGGGAAGPQEAMHIIETGPAPSLLSVSKVLFHPLLDCVVFPPNPISRRNEKKCWSLSLIPVHSILLPWD